ncbi:hypothetical protein [Streptomyces wedmorensis]|uniref:hypothetical protein n=1 Tax=Streptomyces wedmorensis TaxID=43759 RepID=UPI00378B86A9
MMNTELSLARYRLEAALDGLAVTFRGMTADPDETNCVCHWGSAEELAQLKVADAELGPDLLRRTWQAVDWSDHGAVLRRILPQFASALVGGLVEPVVGMEEVGLAFARGSWRGWPAEQAGAVEEFLGAWWAYVLVDPHPAVRAYDVFVLCVEATGTVGPWLGAWEAVRGRAADGHLAEAVAHWEYELLGDRLPWRPWDAEEEGVRGELTAWLGRHASARLRAYGASEDLLHRIRLLGLTGPDRWDDPYWPGHRY